MRPGLVKGAHYTEWIEDVKTLKREGRDDEALALLGHLMDAVEEEASVERWLPAPWYYEQAAKIHRRRRRYADEIAVLSRYEAVSGTRVFSERISKASFLLDTVNKTK
jgi:hypothetical protein